MPVAAMLILPLSACMTPLLFVMAKFPGSPDDKLISPESDSISPALLIAGAESQRVSELKIVPTLLITFDADRDCSATRVTPRGTNSDDIDGNPVAIAMPPMALPRVPRTSV